MENVME